MKEQPEKFDTEEFLKPFKNKPEESSRKIVIKEWLVPQMNKQLVGQLGKVLSHGHNSLKGVGAFIEAKLEDTDLFLQFSFKNILFSLTRRAISIVGEKQKEGGYIIEDTCADLYIGGKRIREIIDPIIEGFH